MADKDIPGCYDPAYQAERLAEEQDHSLDILPHCALCDCTLYPGDKIRTAFHFPVCISCFEELEENEDIVELA